MGGEKPFLFYGGSSDSGSPPHGRGKEVKSLLHFNRVGITPAWAGKRKAWFVLTRSTQDHPRMGGEKACLAAVSLALAGSPPRRLGKGKFRQRLNLFKGITPA